MSREKKHFLFLIFFSVLSCQGKERTVTIHLGEDRSFSPSREERSLRRYLIGIVLTTPRETLSLSPDTEEIVVQVPDGRNTFRVYPIGFFRDDAHPSLKGVVGFYGEKEVEIFSESSVVEIPVSPEPLPSRTLTGKAVSSDGKPVPYGKLWIQFLSPGFLPYIPLGDSFRTGPDGSFSIPFPKRIPLTFQVGVVDLRGEKSTFTSPLLGLETLNRNLGPLIVSTGIPSNLPAPQEVNLSTVQFQVDLTLQTVLGRHGNLVIQEKVTSPTFHWKYLDPGEWVFEGISPGGTTSQTINLLPGMVTTITLRSPGGGVIPGPPPITFYVLDSANHPTPAYFFAVDDGLTGTFREVYPVTVGVYAVSITSQRFAVAVGCSENPYSFQVEVRYITQEDIQDPSYGDLMKTISSCSTAPPVTTVTISFPELVTLPGIFATVSLGENSFDLNAYAFETTVEMNIPLSQTELLTMVLDSQTMERKVFRAYPPPSADGSTISLTLSSFYPPPQTYSAFISSGIPGDTVTVFYGILSPYKTSFLDFLSNQNNLSSYVVFPSSASGTDIYFYTAFFQSLTDPYEMRVFTDYFGTPQTLSSAITIPPLGSSTTSPVSSTPYPRYSVTFPVYSGAENLPITIYAHRFSGPNPASSTVTWVLSKSFRFPSDTLTMPDLSNLPSFTSSFQPTDFYNAQTQVFLFSREQLPPPHRKPLKHLVVQKYYPY